VRMQRFVQADAGDERMGTWIDGRLRNIRIPRIVCWEDAFPVEAGIDAQFWPRFFLLTIIGPSKRQLLEQGQSRAGQGKVLQKRTPSLSRACGHRYPMDGLSCPRKLRDL